MVASPVNKKYQKTWFRHMRKNRETDVIKFGSLNFFQESDRLFSRRSVVLEYYFKTFEYCSFAYVSFFWARIFSIKIYIFNGLKLKFLDNSKPETVLNCLWQFSPFRFNLYRLFISILSTANWKKHEFQKPSLF